MKTELRVLHDMVLFALDEADKKTASGIILPPGVTTNKKLVSGLVRKTGNGYPLIDSYEGWKEGSYWPLSVKIGDYIYVEEDRCVRFVHDSTSYGITSERNILVVETPV